MNSVWKFLAVMLFGSALIAALVSMVRLCKTVLAEEPETDTAWDPVFVVLKLIGVVVPFGATAIGLGYILMSAIKR